MRRDGLEKFIQQGEQSEEKHNPNQPISRRTLMRGGLAAGVAAGIAASGTGDDTSDATAQPLDQVQETPIGPPWWPSRWGSEDEAGASNWITPEKVLAAVGLIKTGQIYEMGRVATAGMPLFGQRGFLLRMVGSPTGGPLGDNEIVWNDEFLSTEIGQVGTCLDGLGHIGCQVGKDGDLSEMRFYNGFTQREISSPYGLKKLGIDKVKPFFTRGVLADVAGLKGWRLNKGEEITLSDLRNALSRQGIAEASLSPGDALFVNTGWGDFWAADVARYNDGEPGIGVEVAQWIVEQQLCLVGADNWGVEVIPNPNPDLAFPVHHELITKEGIFIHEGLDFSALLEAQVYEFAFVLTPLRVAGATGSIARPIAIA